MADKGRGKGAKIALTYFITLIITFLVVGGFMYYFLFVNESFMKGNTNRSANDLPDVSDNSYVPAAEDAQTLLLIADTNKKQTGTCFVVVRANPVERKLTVMTLPTDTFGVVDGVGDKIYEFYRTGGSLAAVKAVESTGITVDKYIKMNEQSLKTFIGVFGDVDYEIPYNLIYEDPDGIEDIIIREGKTHLDADAMRKVITFPEYKGREEYRAKITSGIIVELVNKNTGSGFDKQLDQYFTTVINSGIETNVTAYDFEEKKASLAYISSGANTAVYWFATGQYDPNGYFMLDDTCKNALTVIFG